MTDSYEPSETRYSYRSPLIEELRDRGQVEIGRLTLRLPQKFGFCWGVDRALAMVRDARELYPGRPMWLLNSIIHNPRVNADMQRMGIQFLKGSLAVEGALESISNEDVVIVPAFSAEVEELQFLKERDATIVDTTCPWVIKPHKRALRYIKEGFTTVVHGTVGHDETRSTCSLVRHHGGQYLVVHDFEEALQLAAYLEGKIDGATLMKALHTDAVEPDFEPELHLQKIGLINQTTMLASESREIADMLRRAMVAGRGEDCLADQFRDFDTICAATQENQDAANELVGDKPDLYVVVGGHDSSNTRNLTRVGAEQSVPAYHVEGPEGVSPDWIEHHHAEDRAVLRVTEWLPESGNVTIAFSAGASTPDSLLGDVICSVVEAAGESMPADFAPSAV